MIAIVMTILLCIIIGLSAMIAGQMVFAYRCQRAALKSARQQMEFVKTLHADGKISTDELNYERLCLCRLQCALRGIRTPEIPPPPGYPQKIKALMAHRGGAA